MTDADASRPAADTSAVDRHDDAEWVARAKKGDMSAFERLYRANIGRVYAVCLRMVRDPHTAEDLAQEAFVRAWRNLRTFRGQSAFSTWLHRIAVNLTLTHQRKQGRKLAHEVQHENLDALGSEASVVKPGARLDLDDALGLLPVGARNVFVLYELEGYRHDEIASMLGIAPGTTKAQLHRARRMLREVLA